MTSDQDKNYIEAKKGVLKSLANKMYKMELESHKKGDGPKPKPVPKAMTENKADAKDSPKVSNHVKSMVQNFFKEKKSNDGDASTTSQACYVKRKAPVKAEAPKETKHKPKNRK